MPPSPHATAAGIVGTIDWQSEVSGFCKCPGEALHTSRSGPKDCRINIDGAPTIFCFHAHCSPAVVAANLALRRALGGSDWSLTLPGGKTLRSGDVLRGNGIVTPREVIKAKAKEEGRDIGEQLTLETIRQNARRSAPDIFARYHWPAAQIVADSHIHVSERDADDQFRTWLRLWPAHSRVWIGDVFDSGKPEHAKNFRPVSDWYQIGPAFGNFTCGAAFKPGTFSRSNEAIAEKPFLVVESDTLAKDEVGAVFAYLNNRLRYHLIAVIDTGGKSLHGWFQTPRTTIMEHRLKAGLEALGCDPKLFTYSQPVRVPGAWRNGKLQRLIFLQH